MAEIKNKKQLIFYLQADRMMNRGSFKKTIKSRITNVYNPDYIMQFLEAMRKYSYYKYTHSIQRLYYGYRFRKLGVRLGFSINEDTFGYGLVIPHYGTIVVGKNNIGNYCVLHTSTCITHQGKTIGNGLYLSTGAKIISSIKLGDGVTVGANSVVNKDFTASNVLLTGIPAVHKKDYAPWFADSCNNSYAERIIKIEEFRKELGI